MDETFDMLGQSSSLSPWAGPYVTDMLGKGAALANTPYQAYQGPLTAGASGLQQQAFSGLANLTMPDMTSYNPRTFASPPNNPPFTTSPTGGALPDFTLNRIPGAGGSMPPAGAVGGGALPDFLVNRIPGAGTGAGGPSNGPADVMSSYMSPYLQGALDPQLDAARRQAEIERVNMAGRLGKAGAFGGGRQAIMESELSGALQRNLADITGKGYQTAFEQARDQFNTEEARRMAAAGQAQQYGLQALGAQMGAGATQRDIEQQGIAADIAQFEQERDDPFKKVQFQQSLLQGLPISTQSYQYAEPSVFGNALGGAGDFITFLDNLFGNKDKDKDKDE